MVKLIKLIQSIVIASRRVRPEEGYAASGGGSLAMTMACIDLK